MTVTTWYLEMASPEELRPARAVEGFEVRRVDPPDPVLSRRMYDLVGEPWHWTDRRGWGTARWGAHVSQPDVQTWLGYLEGEPVGYGELGRSGTDVELASFGLLPSFVGRGLGGALLAAGAADAWERGAQRVWLHTCSLDGPHALANYEARGLVQFRVER